MYGEEALKEIIGKTLSSVEKRSDDQVRLTTTEDNEYSMYHCQDCCEHVYIEDIVGDLDDLVGSPIIQAERVSNSDDPKKSDWDESHTWTFYKLATNKGGVTIRWYGSSNGYYSESVDFVRLS